MQNEIFPLSPSQTDNLSDVPAFSVIQQGKRNVYSERTENMIINIQTSSDAVPHILPKEATIAPKTICRDFYNLFVINNIDFSKNEYFMMDRDRCLAQYTEDAIKTEFASLSELAQKRILSFPSIFTNENNNGLKCGLANEKQMAGFGYIRRMKVRKSGIMVYPQVLYLLPLRTLDEALFNLDLEGTERWNQFDRTHWCIKKIDLISELQELGFIDIY